MTGQGRTDQATEVARVTEFYPRSVWTSAPLPAEALTPMLPGPVRGVALHVPGSPEAFGPSTTLQRSARLLEEQRTFHTGTRGWADIGWQAAIDVDGRVFACRGQGYRPAANGNATGNERYGAVLWLLGSAEEPTAAMVAAFRDWRREHWLPAYPAATQVVAHRDLSPTACPGPAVGALIRAETLTTGGTVALTDAEIDAIATRTRDRILAVPYGHQPDGRPVTLGMLWGEVRVNAARAAAGIDLDALASAVVAKLPPGPIDPRALAGAVADELVLRLGR